VSEKPMEIPNPLHSWQVTPAEAVIIQKKIADMVTTCPNNKSLRYIIGVDAAFSDQGKTCIGGAVVWDMQNKLVIEQTIAKKPVTFPYIPGFLSFREIPTLIAALSALHTTADVIMCDGHGIAHPRLCGIAAHLGVLMQMPSLGCGKSRLVGTYQEPGLMRGDKSALLFKNQRIGTVLRSKNNVKPLFISVGNQLSLAQAEQLALQCFAGYRLPEPTRLADKLVAEAKK
jgi:deoxyribonuclease V